MNQNDRQHPRIPLALEVEYRTAGAFLVAYSVNLSKGGIFLETASPAPIGTVLSLRFNVPGVGPLEVTGVVAWSRPAADGKPGGMGVEFEQIEQHHGEAIDRIVAGFNGLRVVVLASSNGARSVLARGVRSLFGTADIAEAADADAVETAFAAKPPDLVLVDLDDSAADGILTLRLAKSLGSTPVPVIASSRDEEARARARELGADEVLANPITLVEMQAAVVRAISRPMSVR